MATRKLSLQRRLTPQEALEEAISAFDRRCEAKNLSPHTREYYRYRFAALTNFLAHREVEVSPAQMTPALIRDFLAYESEHISPLTASHDYITLRAFFRFLLAEDTISDNPMLKVQPVKTKKKVIETFSPEQFEAMLQSTGNDFAGLRMRAILLTLADCGLRVSELCGLTLDDIDKEQQTLHVLGKGNKERIVPFGEAVKRVLSTYIARRGTIEGSQTVFVTVYGEPLSRQRVQRLIRECGDTAKVPNAYPHNFRRFFAVNFVRNGADPFTLQKILGHTDLAMTRRYCELAQTDVRDKHKTFSPGDRFLSAIEPAGKRKRMR